MTNWNAEITRLRAQEQTEFQTGQTQLLRGNERRENQIINELIINYENRVIPSFHILDSFHIPERLSEIKDQVLGGGQIIKTPKDFNQHKELSLRDIWDSSYHRFITKFDNLPPNNNFDLTEEDKRDIGQNCPHATYVLAGPKRLIYYSSTDGDGVESEYVKEGYETIKVVSDGTYLEISGIHIELNKNTVEEINELIKNHLVEYCSVLIRRREYVNSRKDLLLRYNQLQRQKQRRSLLDIFLGK